jgi:glycosyltransferase involved in cell wall biosynthesis
LTTVFHLITTIERGGAENQLLILAREQVTNGLDVHIVFLKGEPELRSDFLSIGATVHSDLAGLTPFLQPFVFGKLLRGRDAIVHSHLPRAELVATFSPARFKFFASRHNSEPFFPGAPRFVSNALARLIEVRANKIIAISSAVQEFLLSQGEVRKHSKIEVVHYGYRPCVERNQAGSKSQSKNYHVGTISRLANQKDIPTMLKAFANIKIENESAQLSILGTGHLDRELREIAKSLSIEDSVTFSGRSSKVIEFLRSLDVFILTSKYEGFGMVLLEAMDAGIPIIASRNSAIPEVLGSDFPGLCETGNIQDFAAKLKLLQSSKSRELFLEIQESRLRRFSA